MSYTKHDRRMGADEQHLFTNVLRDCLGLGPLYGSADDRESKVNYGKQRAQARAQAPTNPQAEDEYPDAALDAAE